MPSARIVTPLVIGSLVVLLSPLTIRADGSSAPAASQAASPSHEGAVQQGLRNLYIVPKVSTGSAANAAPKKPAVSPYKGWSSTPATDSADFAYRPIPRWSENLAARNRSRVSAISGAPDDQDMRWAGLGGNDHPAPQPSIGGYRGFGQYGYGRQGYSDYRRSLRWPDYSRQWNDPVYGSGREDYYSYGDGGGYGDGYGYGPGDYRAATGRWSDDLGYFDYMGNARTESLLKSSLNSRDRGLIAFRDGRYREAVDDFRLACEANQGDPAAQLYAGHALFAIGRYRDAVKYIRKAFELQPRIAFVTFDMRDDYRVPAEFGRQFAALRDALRLAPRDPDRLFMTGYVLYYGGQRDRAYDAFARLLHVNPHDSLAAQLMDACQPPDVVASPSGR